ncbi:cysteine desulfurase/selenocysteine lyase [Rhizomicrobium electricum]|jgi:cysteine desulfurase/selenocysteine lyase|uniref:cysteine desulfurase n=1 Tax=Rhizomicrobium electricum TaxID=480070 RepID=UPI0014241A4F|nr:cysteine desulfurase [Rhizomicrobium electricum]NIJ46786.1 cysteine desulfurase/selenocysteine lyase [Rhizomicrobium electricum]
MSFVPPLSDFSILSKPVNGRRLAYLDSAASAQKPKFVLDAMTEFATSEFANVHRGVHRLAAAATQRYEEARVAVQQFLNAKHSDEIIFTKGGTEALNLVSYAFLSPRISAGDEIVLTKMEHHSNIVPWHFMRERKRAVLKWVELREDGSINPSAVAAQITPKTKLLAITHMSNVLGTVNPLKEIIQIAHAKGVPVVVDGCQGAVHEKVDVQDLDADFYAFTGHKLYGPTGIGALYGKRAHLKTMRPFNGGGEMIAEVTEDKVTYAEPPHRFEAGTPPIIEAVGLAAAIKYLKGFDRAAIKAHELELYQYARKEIGRFKWVRVIGEAEDKGAILSFETTGMHAHDVATILDGEGVAVRAGHHCAQVLMERFGVASTTRASFGLYNTREDVDALIAGLEKARSILL